MITTQGEDATGGDSELAVTGSPRIGGGRTGAGHGGGDCDDVFAVAPPGPPGVPDVPGVLG